MNNVLKEIKDIYSENCVTITLNTHRTKPDSDKDQLTLKNLVNDAKKRLLAEENKRDVSILIERIDRLAASIDHSYNIEALVLFVNENIEKYIRLPIAVENRVTIDHTFATRDLIRSIHLETNYYVLVLDLHKARLIEAFNDKVVTEHSQVFPIENTQFNTTNKVELSNASRKTNLVAAFFNEVDKEVNKIRKINPLPVLICSVESNYHEYLKIADEKHSIFDTFLNQNPLEEKNHEIVSSAWKIMKNYTIEKNNARKEELLKAVGQNNFLSDTNEIWQAIKQGRIQTLFIEESKFQAALWENDQIKYVSNDLRDKKQIVDDIFDELIEENLNHGGDVVFLPNGELSDFNGFGAITRY